MIPACAENGETRETARLKPATRVAALLVMLTLVAFRTRDLDAIAGARAIDGEVILQLVIWLMLGALLLFLVWRGKLSLTLIGGGPTFWFLALVAVDLASTVYSVSPGVTLFFAAQLVIFVLLLACAELTLQKMTAVIILYVALNWILLGLGTAGITFGQGWITDARTMYLRYGGSPDEGWRFATALGHPSQISVVASMAACELFSRLDGRSRKRDVFWFLVLVATVLLTVSRTAIFGLAAGLLVILATKRAAYLAALVFGVFSVVLIMMPQAIDAVAAILTRGQSQEQLDSFSGRSDIYSAALQRLGEPWWGEGFRALRVDPLMERGWGHGVAHAHNALLTIAIETGIPGALVAFACLFSAVVCCFRLMRWRRIDDSVGQAAAAGWGLLCPILAFSMLDSGFAVNLDAFVAVFIMYLFGLRRACLSARRRMIVPNANEQVWLPCPA